MAIVFEEQADGLYDLKQDGRSLEYDVESWDLQGALRRRRLDRHQGPIFVEDASGHRSRLSR